METVELIDQAFAHGMIQVREEVSAFVEFLRTRKLQNVLEIGSESGGTFYLWCQLTSLGGLKISLDKPDGASGSWRYVQPEKLAQRTALFRSWAPRVKVITGDSHDQKTYHEVLQTLDGAKLDFLFIDGDHSYEGVAADWNDYRGLVREGGLVAFHDVNHLGPQKLWRSLKQDHPCELNPPAGHNGFTFMEFNQKLHWAGIGVVQI